MFGIIGNPLLQSFSPDFFRKKFATLGIDDTYLKFEIKSIEELKIVLKTHPQLKGLNVTIPYKQKVINLIDELDATAKEIGAVNCIKIEYGKLKGYNTDAIGFLKTLRPLVEPHHTHALILGTGGASKAVAHALQQLNINYQFVSRKLYQDCLTYQQLDANIIQHHSLIINTTPLGMMPDIDAAPPIPYHLLTPKHLLYDLVYNPAESLFLQRGKAQGTATKNGYDMLVAQAEAAWDIWNNPKL